MGTEIKIKERIKYLRFFYLLSEDAIVNELGVTKRTVIMALREESKEQYKTRYYMERLIAVKEEIKNHIKGFDFDNITTMKTHDYMETLGRLQDKLSGAELDVYDEVLE